MDTEKSKETNSLNTNELSKVPEGFSDFDDVISNGEFLSNMHKVPEGFQHFVDISSSVNENGTDNSAIAENDTDVNIDIYAEPDDDTEVYADGEDYYGSKELQDGEESSEEEEEPAAETYSDEADSEVKHEEYSAKHAVHKKRNSYSNFNNAVAAVFCSLLFLVLITTVVIKDKEYSESENRVLAQMPSLTFSTLADGSFMKNFESYLTDQFPLRDSAISLKTYVDRMIGVKKENGVYIGKDGFLFDSPTAYNKDDMTEKVKAISAFTAKYPKMKRAFVVSPNSSYIYSDMLPESVKLPNQSQQLDKVEKAVTDNGLSFIDSVSILKNAKRQKDAPLLFYKTDHHWTTRGAYEVFKELARIWKLDTTKTKHYFYTVSGTFEGTLGSKAGVHNATDTIEICVPGKSLGTYVVNYESQQKKKATLFDNEKLEQKNQYEVFLGGNFDKVIISTTSMTNNNLLLIKDSYANCMIPMLTAHFSKIVVIDPRYLTDNMDDIIKENDFTHILFLYNLNTFLEDSSVIDALSD